MFWSCLISSFFFFVSDFHEPLVNKMGPQKAFRYPGFDLLKADQDCGFWIAESLHGMRDTENTHRDYGIKRKFGSRLRD